MLFGIKSGRKSNISPDFQQYTCVTTVRSDHNVPNFHWWSSIEDWTSSSPYSLWRRKKFEIEKSFLFYISKTREVNLKRYALVFVTLPTSRALT